MPPVRWRSSARRRRMSAPSRYLRRPSSAWRLRSARARGWSDSTRGCRPACCLTAPAGPLRACIVWPAGSRNGSGAARSAARARRPPSPTAWPMRAFPRHPATTPSPTPAPCATSGVGRRAAEPARFAPSIIAGGRITARPGVRRDEEVRMPSASALLTDDIPEGLQLVEHLVHAIGVAEVVEAFLVAPQIAGLGQGEQLATGGLAGDLGDLGEAKGVEAAAAAVAAGRRDLLQHEHQVEQVLVEVAVE